MDSCNDSASTNKPKKPDHDTEKNRNGKNTARQSGQGDNAENTFTSSSNQSLNFVPFNGSSENHLNEIVSNQCEQYIQRGSECSSATKCLGSRTRDTWDREIASTSRSGSNNPVECNYDLQVCQRHRVCQDKAGISSINMPSTSLNTGVNSCSKFPSENPTSNYVSQPTSGNVGYNCYNLPSTSANAHSSYNLPSISVSEGTSHSSFPCTSAGPTCGRILPSLNSGQSSISFPSTSAIDGLDSRNLPPSSSYLPSITTGPGSTNLSAASDTNIPIENAEITFKESRKRPSSLKLNPDDDSSSDTGNDDYSLGSEDGCIYTYRGGEHLADLPSSFFSLDMGLPLDRQIGGHLNFPAQQAGANVREGSRASSPDMDFLEMDFDPGPSNEADTGDESSPDSNLDNVNQMPEESEPVRGVSPKPAPIPAHVSVIDHSIPSTSKAHRDDHLNMPSTSRGVPTPIQPPSKPPARSVEPPPTHSCYGPFITHVNWRGEQILVRRTIAICTGAPSINHHMLNGDLVVPKEKINNEEDNPNSSLAILINQGQLYDTAAMSTAVYHMSMAKKLMADSTPQPGFLIGPGLVEAQCAERPGVSPPNLVDAPRSMVWSEREACERQVTQIGTSACGATAVVNVFIALSVPVSVDRVNAAVNTRLRANSAPLPRYLLSRSVAGCTAADVAAGLQRASDGLVTARFFPTYPERAVSLSHFLGDWIALGAVPIITLNLQLCSTEAEPPDAWHHQMVFGVSGRGVYLCNPVECVHEAVLWARLSCPSTLLVRARDVLSRFNAHTDLAPLAAVPDPRYHSYNVLGQVVNLLREWRATGWNEHGTRTRHIRLPAAYVPGVTVAVLTGSEAHRRLMYHPDLPLLAPFAKTEE